MPDRTLEQERAKRCKWCAENRELSFGGQHFNAEGLIPGPLCTCPPDSVLYEELANGIEQTQRERDNYASQLTLVTKFLGEAEVKLEAERAAHAIQMEEVREALNTALDFVSTADAMQSPEIQHAAKVLGSLTSEHHQKLVEEFAALRVRSGVWCEAHADEDLSGQPCPCCAAVMVADLQAQIAGMKREWVPISERLPEPNVSVLVYMPRWEHYGPGIYRAIRVPGFHGDSWRWHSTAWSCGRDVRAEEITHWMPLPDVPRLVSDCAAEKEPNA